MCSALDSRALQKGPLYMASRESKVEKATLKEPVTQNRWERAIVIFSKKREKNKFWGAKVFGLPIKVCPHTFSPRMFLFSLHVRVICKI